MSKVREISVTSIRCPSDVKLRENTPEVKTLAASIAQEGLLHPIVLNAKTKELVCGRSRLAAVRRLGWKKVPAVFVEPNDEKWAKRAEIVENLRRRNYTGEEQDRLKAQYEALFTVAQSAGIIVEDDEPDSENDAGFKCQADTKLPTASKKRGRPPVVGPAREKAAAELGITTEAVKQAAKRSRQREREAIEPPAPPSSMEQVQGAIDEIDSLMRKALNVVNSKLTKEVFPRSGAAMLYDAIREAGALARHMRPHAADPRSELGWLTKSDLKAMTNGAASVEAEEDDGDVLPF